MQLGCKGHSIMAWYGWYGYDSPSQTLCKKKTEEPKYLTIGIKKVAELKKILSMRC